MAARGRRRRARALAERLDRDRDARPTAPVLVTIGAGDIFKLGEALVEGEG